MTSDVAAFHELITSSAEKPPDRIYMSAARMTSSCLLAANFAASTRVSRAATTSFGSVPSTTQMHLSPAARPASREGEQDLVALELVGVEAADVIARAASMPVTPKSRASDTAPPPTGRSCSKKPV
jgi:hypothetical protein